MEAEKEKKALGFNVQKYLDWHGGFYEPKPPAATSLLETFTAKMEAMAGGMEREKWPQLEKSGLVEFDQWEKKQAPKRIWEKVKTPIWEKELFGILVELVTGEPLEVEEIAKEIRRGILPALTILEAKKAEYLNGINGDLLHWFCIQNPLTASIDLLQASATFTDIQVLQWIESGLIGQATEPTEPTEPTKGKNGLSLSQKVLTLERLGFFELPEYKDLRGANGRHCFKVLALVLGEDENNLRKCVDGLTPGHKNSPRNELSEKVVSELLPHIRSKN